MQSAIQITLCLFASIGFLYCLRVFSDFLWTQKVLSILRNKINDNENTDFEEDYYSVSDSDSLPEESPLSAKITILLPQDFFSELNENFSEESRENFSDSDIEYFAAYVKTMLSRIPLGDFVEEIIFKSYRKG